MAGMLFVVATPIGNLEDLTLRASRVLSEADLIACEDTRVTGRLLQFLDVRKTLVSVHEHTKSGALERLIRFLREGKNVAYVSDAGTPGMNDPGGKLVAAAFAADVRVVPVPGASALTAAISVCGFPMDEFAYLGFAPHKKGREKFFREIAARETPSVFLESTHRIEKTLSALASVLEPTRIVFVGRELTKLHETLYRGTIDEVRKRLQATSLKGEFVVMIGPQ